MQCTYKAAVQYSDFFICLLFRYKMLSRPYAFGCIMRLRTSSQFKIADSVNTLRDMCITYISFFICCVWHVYFLLCSTVWPFLPRSSVHACSAHKLLWLFCYIQLRLWVWKGFTIFQVTNILFPGFPIIHAFHKLTLIFSQP